MEYAIFKLSEKSWERIKTSETCVSASCSSVRPIAAVMWSKWTLIWVSVKVPVSAILWLVELLLFFFFLSSLFSLILLNFLFQNTTHVIDFLKICGQLLVFGLFSKLSEGWYDPLLHLFQFFSWVKSYVFDFAMNYCLDMLTEFSKLFFNFQVFVLCSLCLSLELLDYCLCLFDLLFIILKIL